MQNPPLARGVLLFKATGDHRARSQFLTQLPLAMVCVHRSPYAGGAGSIPVFRSVSPGLYGTSATNLSAARPGARAPAGGRAVAGSNPVSPTREAAHFMGGFVV
jgi:hypothetical protein